MTIRLEKVGKSFGETQVLQDVSLELPERGVTALVGASGSGKTTLLNLLAGLLQPSTGRILFDGRDVTALDTADRQIGYVFQNFALFPHLDVLDNVAFGLRVRGIARRDRYARAREALAMVQLQDFARRPVAALSGGQKQRVALARALVISPRILLLDEPLSALDPILRETLRLELRDLLAPLPVATLIVTHDQVDAFVLAERIVMLRAGRIVQIGTPRELYEQPLDVDVARFFGPVNLLDETGEMLRPEDLVPTSGGRPGDLEIVVQRAAYLGDRLRVFGTSPSGKQITADLPRSSTARPGDRLRLARRALVAPLAEPRPARVL